MESNAITSEAIRDCFEMNGWVRTGNWTKDEIDSVKVFLSSLNEKVARLDKRNRVVK